MPGVLPLCYPSNLVLFACHSPHVWYRHACHFHLLRDWGSRKLNDIADLGSNADLPDSQTWRLNHHPELLWTQSLGSSIMRCLYLSSLPWSQVLTETLPCLTAPDIKHCFPDVVSLSPCNTPGMKSSHSQWLLKGGKKSIHTKAFYELSSFVERWGISCHIAVSSYLWAFILLQLYSSVCPHVSLRRCSNSSSSAKWFGGSLLGILPLSLFFESCFFEKEETFFMQPLSRPPLRIANVITYLELNRSPAGGWGHRDRLRLTGPAGPWQWQPGDEPHPAEAQDCGREAGKCLNWIGILLKRRSDCEVGDHSICHVDLKCESEFSGEERGHQSRGGRAEDNSREK